MDQPSLHQAVEATASDLPTLLALLAQSSKRPRYAFMVLSLISRVAGPGGSAGPLIRDKDQLVPLRDWLADSLMPMGQRVPRRAALVQRVRMELAANDTLPENPAEADKLVDAEVRERVRAGNKTSLSKTVSELVNAGLLRRHYQGYCVDHHNRGARRQAVYALTPAAQSVLGAGHNERSAHQGRLAL